MTTGSGTCTAGDVPVVTTFVGVGPCEVGAAVTGSGSGVGGIVSVGVGGIVTVGVGAGTP